MKRCLSVVALTFPWTTSTVVWILAVDFKVDQVFLAAARSQSSVSAKVHLCISVLVASPFQDWKAQKRCDLFSPSALQRLTLLHVNSNQCLDMPSEEDKMVPTLRDCNNGRSQQWLLRNMTLSIWSSPKAPHPHPPHPSPRLQRSLVSSRPQTAHAATGWLWHLSPHQPGQDAGTEAAAGSAPSCGCFHF